MRLTIKGATAKNTRYADKPNEDLFFFDEASGFAMILDGVSRDRENGIYPTPSPACRADNAFADAAQAVLLKKTVPHRRTALKRQHMPGTWPLPPPTKASPPHSSRARSACLRFLPNTSCIMHI